jgi:ribA/ribD-fused uncharacterized protein
MAEHYIFFYMPKAKYGEFCNWFPSIFVLSKTLIHHTLFGLDKIKENTATEDAEDVITFECSEQYYMYCKATRFGDADIQQKILGTSDPKEQKRWGRLVDFDASIWDQCKANVMYIGLMAKFSQNSKLKGKLLATRDKILVEAASKDRVWGVGYTEKHAMQFKQHWGENLLGKTLMRVRNNLRYEREQERL